VKHAVAGVLACAALLGTPAALAAPPSPGKTVAAAAHRHLSLRQRRERARRRAWTRAFGAARRYARSRLGRVSVALRDDQGRLHQYLGRRTFYSASLVKAMLLVAYLRRGDIRHRRLSGASRALLTPMIERSDNGAASRVRNIVGNAGLARLARRVGMYHFATAVSWGDTHLAASDQVRFFAKIDRLVPRRHRGYARYVLSHVIPEQRWSIPQVTPIGANVYFKGGWRPSVGGWIVNQSALVVKGHRRVSLSVLTDHDRSFGYGQETIRSVAARLLPVLAKHWRG
jgi:hypothetical protein